MTSATIAQKKSQIEKFIHKIIIFQEKKKPLVILLYWTIQFCRKQRNNSICSITKAMEHLEILFHKHFKKLLLIKTTYKVFASSLFFWEQTEPELMKSMNGWSWSPKVCARYKHILSSVFSWLSSWFLGWVHLLVLKRIWLWKTSFKSTDGCLWFLSAPSVLYWINSNWQEKADAP